MAHAIVIGASIAGLLAARVLSNHFEQVTLIERDHLTENPEHRSGVPQARHLHALMLQGKQILDEYFPGFSDELTTFGAPVGEWGKDVRFFTQGGWSGAFHTGLFGNTAGRVKVEWLVRRRVQALPNVTFLTERLVEGLTTDQTGKTVNGVKLTVRGSKETETLTADLVVDASGRRSKTPEWLQELGYSAPETTIINAHSAYATRWFKLPASGKLPTIVTVQPTTRDNSYRGGGLMPTDNGQLVVTLLGVNHRYPPTDEAGFMEFARSLPTQAIYNIIANLEPASPIYGYRNLENQMRHYERLSRRPENFIVMGDAFCALNPIYGQGMSSAALQARKLDYMLRESDVRHLQGFAAKCQKALVKVVSGAWLISTSEDMRYPDVEGAKPNLADRLAHRYFDLVSIAMAYDNEVTTAFIKVMNMLEHPLSLMRPRIMARVLWHNLRHEPAASTDLQNLWKRPDLSGETAAPQPVPTL